jgi:hypothetical protein
LQIPVADFEDMGGLANAPAINPNMAMRNMGGMGGMGMMGMGNMGMGNMGMGMGGMGGMGMGMNNMGGKSCPSSSLGLKAERNRFPEPRPNGHAGKYHLVRVCFREFNADPCRTTCNPDLSPTPPAVQPQ